MDLPDPRDYPGPDDPAPIATLEERMARMFDSAGRIHDLMDEAEYWHPDQYREALVRFMHDDPAKLIAIVRDRAQFEAQHELDIDIELARTAGAYRDPESFD